MKIYLEQYDGEEKQHVYINVDGGGHLEIVYSHGSISGIKLHNKVPLTVRLNDHLDSDLKTGEVPGISDEMFTRLIEAANVAEEFRKILMPIAIQPEQFLQEARLRIAPSI